MRIIGLDYGTKTVGVALSDALGITAQPEHTNTTKQHKNPTNTNPTKQPIIEENDVEKIVVGLPKNMNNTVGERAIACEEFAKNLERRTGLEVIMWDERLTTVSAEKALMESGVRRENRKAVIDQIAAVFILQGYLDCQANAGR